MNTKHILVIRPTVTEASITIDSKNNRDRVHKVPHTAAGMDLPLLVQLVLGRSNLDSRNFSSLPVREVAIFAYLLSSAVFTFKRGSVLGAGLLKDFRWFSRTLSAAHVSAA